MNKILLTTVFAAALFVGCTSNIRPIEPIRRVETWVSDEPTTQSATEPTTQIATTTPTTESTSPLITSATMPDTQPATQSAATQSATTRVAASQPTDTPDLQVAINGPIVRKPSHPGQHLVVKIINPNQTARYIYKASYDNIWQQATLLLNKTGFFLDRKDYRLGVLTTKPLASAQIVEPWKPQNTNANDALENTINSQQRSVRISISPVEDKPDFYEIAIEVLVERLNNPIESIGGPVFIEGSGFGRNTTSLRSDYSPVNVTGVGPSWYVVGHDPDLEHKLLHELFQHI